MSSYILFHQTTDSVDLTEDGETSDEGNFRFLEFLVNVLQVNFCLLEACVVHYFGSKSCFWKILLRLVCSSFPPVSQSLRCQLSEATN